MCKKDILFIFLFSLLLFPLITSCQYEDPVYTEVEKNVTYFYGKTLYFHVLEISDVVYVGSQNPYWSWIKTEAGFTVTNKHDKQIMVTVYFTNNGLQDVEYLDLDPLGYARVNRGTSGNILPETIRLVFENEDIEMTTKIEQVETGKTCRICPNGKPCLDDRSQCNSNSSCGSGICNIAGVCGEVNSSFVVSCLNGEMNCNNQFCLLPSIKNVGESYNCEWECSEGTIPCEGICREVSSKKAGQEYHCIEECKTGRSKEGKCLYSKEAIIIFWAFILVLISVGIGYFGMYRGKKGFEEAKKAKEELKKLKEEKEGLEEEKENIQKDLEEIKNKKENLRESLEKEIKILNEKSRKAKGIAKQELDKEIEERRKKVEEKLIALRKEEERAEEYHKKIKNKLNRKEIELKEKEKSLEKREDELEKSNYDYYIRSQLDKYKKKYETASRKVVYDEKEGYFALTSKFNSNSEPLHRYIYSKEVSNNIGLKDIHHIDYNPLNDETYNLIALSKENHRKIKHSNLIKNDWKGNLEKLKNDLNWNDEDLPEHIKEHLSK